LLFLLLVKEEMPQAEEVVFAGKPIPPPDLPLEKGEE